MNLHSIYISDGDGGLNNRILGYSRDHGGLGVGSLLFVVGKNSVLKLAQRKQRVQVCHTVAQNFHPILKTHSYMQKSIHMWR